MEKYRDMDAHCADNAFRQHAGVTVNFDISLGSGGADFFGDFFTTEPS